MRATEIIRQLMCLVDEIDGQDTDLTMGPVNEPVPGAVAVAVHAEPNTEFGDGPRRFKQIFDILSAEKDQMYSNSPDEVVAGIDSVTKDAGGGWNGPKHPSDLRVHDPSMYPNAGAK
jgi:hypothetical protein